MVSRCLHGPTEEWTMSVLQRTCGCCLAAKLCLTICNPKEPARLLCPCDSPGKNTGVTCHFLLQGIFSTQGLNPYLLHLQVDSLPLSHQESSLKKNNINFFIKYIKICICRILLIWKIQVLTFVTRGKDR